MITVSKLIELLQQLPGDAYVNAYEGEDIGIVIQAPNTGASGCERYDWDAWFIRARDSEEEDDQSEFFKCMKDNSRSA